ncbi:MAG: MarR family winged helix-turn-helix transcriptional regulator [Bacteroidota bacterium]
MSNFPNIERLDARSCISSKMRKCHRVVAEVFRKYLMPFDITSSQLSILFVVAKVEGVTQSQLAAWLILEKSTVSRNMKRLLSRKLIQKESNQQLQLTHGGKMLLEQIIPEWEKAMAEIKLRLKDEGETALNILTAQLLR